ncbi:MAG TPA: hypothetical protein VFV19_08050 [Candidatus Polarisedimenticolaceae bacterium]|nr:hypothetical protein [Candidatus Polarisedimenticolaceae bacterium]
MSLHDLAAYLGNLLAAAACHLAAWEIGRRISPRLTSAFIAAVLGFVVLGYAAFALGAMHLLYRPALVLLTGVPALSGAVHLLRAKPWRSLSPNLDDAAFFVAAAVVIAAIPLALAPVLEHDDNVYHLALPKLYLAHHAMTYQPGMYANMPHLVELLYTYPMAWGDFTAAKALNLFFNFWTLIGLRSVVRDELGRGLGGLAALLFVSNPIVQWHLGRGYVEPVIATFLLAAATLLLRFVRDGERRWLVLAGICCGAAAGAKYQGWIFSAAIFLAAARPAVRMLVPFGLLVAPWLVKSFMLTGDPVYPMAYRLFGGRGLSDVQVLHLSRHFGYFSLLHRSLGDALRLPFEMVAARDVFLRPGFSAVMLALILAALLMPRSYRPGSRRILAMTLLGCAGWAVSGEVGRFLVAWVPVMAIAAMLPVARFAGRPRLVAAAAAVVMAAGALQVIAVPVEPAQGVSRAALFTSSRDELLGRNTNFDLCAILNGAVPPGGKVLGMFENRFFFLDREVIADSNYEVPASLARLREAGDAKKFADELRAQGVTHVVVRKDAANQYFEQQLLFPLLDDRLYPQSALDRDRSLFIAFLQTQLVMLVENQTTAVFRLGDLPKGATANP